MPGVFRRALWPTLQLLWGLPPWVVNETVPDSI